MTDIQTIEKAILKDNMDKLNNDRYKDDPFIQEIKKERNKRIESESRRHYARAGEYNKRHTYIQRSIIIMADSINSI